MTDPAITTLVDGKPGNALSTSDRGLAYGDGLFETLRILDGEIVLYDMHLARLQRGCERLAIVFDDLPARLAEDILTLHVAGIASGILKIIVTRGNQGRGYRPAEGTQPCRVVSTSLFDRDDRATTTGISVQVCQTRLGRNPVLAGIKHLNRLEQVLAAAELDRSVDGVHEGLMLDDRGHVIEGTKTNLFAVLGGKLLTPRLDECGVAGVLREYLMKSATIAEADISLEEIAEASELFVTNSVIGIHPIVRIITGDANWQYAVGDQTRSLQAMVRDSLGHL